MEDSPSRDVIHVVAAVIRKGDLVLTALRSDTEVWEFPGGKQEAGETRQECVIREVWEELALVIEVDEIIAEFSVTETDRTIRFTFYSAQALTGTLALSVHTDVLWTSPRALDGLSMHEADRGVSRLLARELERELER